MEVTSLLFPFTNQYDEDLGDLENECIKRSTLTLGLVLTNSGGWHSINISSNPDDFYL